MRSWPKYIARFLLRCTVLSCWLIKATFAPISTVHTSVFHFEGNYSITALSVARFSARVAFFYTPWAVISLIQLALSKTLWSMQSSVVIVLPEGFLVWARSTCASGRSSMTSFSLLNRARCALLWKAQQKTVIVCKFRACIFTSKLSYLMNFLVITILPLNLLFRKSSCKAYPTYCTPQLCFDLSGEKKSRSLFIMWVNILFAMWHV